MSIIYLNGNFVPKEQAAISVMDRGFLFADGVYEVIPVFAGKLLGIDAHLKRLDRSLEALHIAAPLSKAEWHEIIQELLKINKVSDNHSIYIQVTRGADEYRDHKIPSNIQPTIMACLMPSKHLDFNLAKQGFRAITLPDTRRANCFIKAISLLPNILLYEQARRCNAFEAILIRNGMAIEATSSNIFIVKDDCLITPPLSPNILAGITRDLILAIAIEHEIPHRVIDVPEADLLAASEIWVTGSTKEICPIISLNDKSVGTGKVGPVWFKVREHYENYKRSNTVPAAYTNKLMGENIVNRE